MPARRKPLVTHGRTIHLGQKASVWRSVGHFRFVPVKRHSGSLSACLKGANRRQCRARGAAFPAASKLVRTVALIGQERTSKIMLNGVSVARRKRLKPASVAT